MRWACSGRRIDRGQFIGGSHTTAAVNPSERPRTVHRVFDDFNRWVRGDGLEIVLICSAAVLLLRAVSALVRLSEARSEQQRRSGNPAALAAARTRDAIVQASRYGVAFMIVFVSLVLVLTRFGVPLSSLVPVATVLGVAVGFGAQRIVADMLSGFFLVAERQFGVGDTVRVGPVGEETGITGVVEEVTLRVTRLRRFDGDVVTIPNGELRQVANMSRDWARLVVNVPLTSDDDIDAIAARLDRIASDMASESRWRAEILETPSVSGVEELTAGALQLRLMGRTLPSRQWSVARELRRRVAAGLRDVPASAGGVVAEVHSRGSSTDETPAVADRSGRDGNLRDGTMRY
jgi:small conductance mechanosensitive channel